MTTSRPAALTSASMTASSSTASSKWVRGGRNTCTRPSRSSTPSAVGGASSTGTTAAPVPGRHAARVVAVEASAAADFEAREGDSDGFGGNGPRGSKGERSGSGSGGVQVSESSGRRRPAGESPGSSTRRPRRSTHSLVAQPPGSVRRWCSGMIHAEASPMRSSRAATTEARPASSATAGSSGATSSAGGSPAGVRASFSRSTSGSS